jgi:hypothetical protein
MLAIIIADYVLQPGIDKSQVMAFLRRKNTAGHTYGALLVKNFHYVLQSSKAYSQSPEIENLIHLKGQHNVGQWRDSGQGLGFGKIPYDVNVILVPSALSAIANLTRTGLLFEFSDSDQLALQAKKQSQQWRDSVATHFKVQIPVEQAQNALKQYAEKLGINSESANLSAQPGEELEFTALALQQNGKAIPIIHSDMGYALLFSQPGAADLEQMLSNMLRPFPAGLLTPVGLLVANPVFAEQQIQDNFTRHHYHGTVIWSWQQAMLAAGIQGQLKRSKLPQSTRRKLLQAQQSLWQVINATNATRDAELWSWSYQDGQYKTEPFGQRAGDKTESNAAQLWSTVYLAVKAATQQSAQ